MSEITKICQTLTDKGITPTVGLIKAKLTQKTPLPDIISGLKAFQANQPHEPASIKEPSLADRVMGLEKRCANQQEHIQTLQEQVESLRFMVKQLSNNQ
jgi:predicted RNase H-like nuclease (RuvC/YqgF family)